MAKQILIEDPIFIRILKVRLQLKARSETVRDYIKRNKIEKEELYQLKYSSSFSCYEN